MNEERQEKYVGLYESLYSDYIQEGMTLDEAQELAHQRVELTSELIEDILEELDPFWCHIRRAIPVEYLINWDNLSQQEKEGSLHQLGIDSRLPWRKKEGYYRNNEGKVVKGKFIEGSERTDEQWVKSGYASWDAILEYQEFLHGSEHIKDLNRISRR